MQLNLHLSPVLALFVASPPCLVSCRGLWAISYPGGRRSVIAKLGWFNKLTKISIIKHLSKITFLMDRALYQTEWKFKYPIAISAAADTRVDSVKEILHDLDLDCHIPYLNDDFLTLPLNSYEWHRYLNSSTQRLGYTRALIAYNSSFLGQCCRGEGAAIARCDNWLVLGKQALHHCLPKEGKGTLPMAWCITYPVLGQWWFYVSWHRT